MRVLKPFEQPIVILDTHLQGRNLKITHMCYQDSSQGQSGEFPLATTPSILLNVLTDYGLDAQTLARLEATCTYFRRPAQIYPYGALSLSEIAAFHMCNLREIFKRMTNKELENLRKICGGSWKFVLRFILAGEACNRRGKALAVAGPGHSMVVTLNGYVYSFGCNCLGELGIGTTEDQAEPCRIRSLQGIRIIQVALAPYRTMLVSETGCVYSFGEHGPGELEPGEDVETVLTPQPVESLKDIFVVQAVFSNFFTAFLSREGRVYTVSWGKNSKLGHDTDLDDSEPRPLLGALENVPVVQIAAGFCYLLALACQPSGMSVYSVGCGLGGKLGHGTFDNEPQPRLIEKFETLKLQPKMIAAGAWHCAVVGADGRVCTWGWGNCGCLGHGDTECQSSPKVVSALANVKAVHVAAGDYTTFVVSEEGDLYSFGNGNSPCIGHNIDEDDLEDPEEQDEEGEEPPKDIVIPKLVTSLKELNERIVHVSVSDSADMADHTIVITESGKLYAFGCGQSGQLGGKLEADFTYRWYPEIVNIDLG